MSDVRKMENCRGRFNLEDTTVNITKTRFDLLYGVYIAAQGKLRRPDGRDQLRAAVQALRTYENDVTASSLMINAPHCIKGDE